MKKIASPKINSKKAAILVTTMFLCTIVALSTVWLVSTLLDQQKTNRRRRELLTAYYAAQSGLSQVLHWGNFPIEYDNNTGTSAFFFRDLTTNTFPNLEAALPRNSGTSLTITSNKLRSFVSKYNLDISKIESIELIAPADSDPVPCVFKVRSVGSTPSGAKRSVFAYLNPNPLQDVDLQLGAGIISLAMGIQNGNGIAHWGESWSRSDFSLINKSQADNLDNTSREYDPFARYRTEARLLFNSTWKEGIGMDVVDVATARYPGRAPARGNYANGFEQFIPQGTLDWPDFLGSYQAFKDLARMHGRYYSTDSAGNIYRSGIKDKDHKVDFVIEFADADRESSPYDFVFIDTIDGNPPAANNSNIATISNSGTMAGMKGIYYICSNYRQGGSGNPADLHTAEKPILNSDGRVSFEMTTLRKVFLDGNYLHGWKYAVSGAAGCLWSPHF